MKKFLLVLLIFSMNLGIVYAEPELELKYIVHESYTNQYPIFRLDNYSNKPISFIYSIPGTDYTGVGIIEGDSGHIKPYYIKFPQYPADGKTTITVELEYIDSKGNIKAIKESSLPIPIYNGITFER